MNDNKKAYNYAIFLLSKRDYSIYKMRQKLYSKEYNKEVIDETIEKLLEQNYLREEEYKRMRIKALLIKGYANQYIIRKLSMEELNTNDEDIDQLRELEHLSFDSQINYLIQKKLRNKEIPTEFEPKMKLKNKLLNFLASKGYNYSEASEAIKPYL